MTGLLIIIGIIILINIFSNRSGKKSSQPGNYMPKNPSRSIQKTKRTLSSRRIADGLPPNFEFNEEFVRAFDLMEKTNECIFVTGKAGTGKSTLLQYFRQNTKKKVVILAPTGVAAINVDGQTIHSFFKFPPRFIQRENIRRKRDRELIQKIDMVVIDEVSMVRADLMDGVDYSLRINRDEMKLPFGGVQVIFFGDLFQLPPVVDKEMRDIYDEKYRTPYFFSAEVFNRIKVKGIELTKIYRQTNTDFINLLNKVRSKEHTEEDLEFLNSRVIKNIADGLNHCITLTTTNNDASLINETRLNKLPSKEYRYTADVQGEFEESSYPTDFCLKLKKGAQVILIKNDPDKRWVNGTIGTINDLADNSISVEIEGAVHQVTRVVWEKIIYEYNEEEDKVEQKVMGTFTQYPIKLAWAITIHKSQGQTFDNVIIDFGDGAFAHGQAYVALSRCTSLGGVILKRPVIHSDIIFDERIHEFKQRIFSSTGQING